MADDYAGLVDAVAGILAERYLNEDAAFAEGVRYARDQEERRQSDVLSSAIVAACDAEARATAAEARAQAVEGELSREARAHGVTIDERDAAEEALSQAYYLIIGRSPEWSSAFGHKEALSDIDDAQYSLRKAALTPAGGTDR